MAGPAACIDDGVDAEPRLSALVESTAALLAQSARALRQHGGPDARTAAALEQNFHDVRRCASELFASTLDTQRETHSSQLAPHASAAAAPHHAAVALTHDAAASLPLADANPVENPMARIAESPVPSDEPLLSLLVEEQPTSAAEASTAPCLPLEAEANYGCTTIEPMLAEPALLSPSGGIHEVSCPQGMGSLSPATQTRKYPPTETHAAERHAAESHAPSLSRLLWRFVDISGDYMHRCPGFPMLHPEGGFCKAWLCYMYLCYAFTALFVPLETAFDDHFHAHQSSGLQWLLKVAPNLAVDITFLLDIALCFRIGFYREGQLIMEPSEVTRRYLHGRCALDALCTIPFVCFMWVRG